jgi:excinuclease UvrABC nuclease subunit
MEMAQPRRLKSFLEKNEIDVLSWGKGRKSEYLDVPEILGVYALYWGTTLQYIGKAKKLRRRLGQWDSEDWYNGYYRIPFGSFAWFAVRKSQVNKAEAILIHYYDPPYNEVYPQIPD